MSSFTEPLFKVYSSTYRPYLSSHTVDRGSWRAENRRLVGKKQFSGVKLLRLVCMIWFIPCAVRCQVARSSLVQQLSRLVVKAVTANMSDITVEGSLFADRFSRYTSPQPLVSPNFSLHFVN